ncbi:MAG: tetratricopeptide repeat protein [Candidatus Abyssobacteria bacterium SURF_5]|uniref:Tetratricopeptide repeat protein n=1 Tax=Abyssobacteria bacterium (strain SURF_5) TaxID=2093360 RepID=A0A3A4N746_ABYX5|nr:MAG: tetratricopeptide repeat protein [Candidatus Abyssubacteria bacterium SURF_5]
MKSTTAKTVAFLLILSVLPYLNTFSNDFVGYDDQNLIQANEQIRSLSADNIKRMFTPRLRGNYQPLRALSYAIDYAVWGPQPFGFHLTNTILNSISVVLVWLLLRRVMDARTAAVSAAIFAVMPIHVESVAWMSSRKDVLSLAFFLLAILLYDESSLRKNRILYAASLAAAAGALLSKLTAVTLPLCILLVQICRDGWPDAAEWKRKAAWLLPHFMLVGIVIGLNFLQPQMGPQHGDALASLEEIGRPVAGHVWLSMPLVVWRYVRLMLVPYHLSTHYEILRITSLADARFWIPFLALLAVVVMTIALFARGKRALAFCFAWFFMTFLPTSNIIPTAAMLVDRYMHTPSIGIAALIGIACMYPVTVMAGKGSPSYRRLALTPMIALIILFTILTIRRNTDWRDTQSLFSRTLLVNPRSVDARLAIGAVLENEGQLNPAIDMYREALEIDPGNYRVLYNLGVAFLKKGSYLEAIRALEESKTANPIFSATRFNLALAYYHQKRFDRAIAEHTAALELDPHLAVSNGALGRIYLELGEYDLAMKHLNLALRDQPDLVPALVDRIELYMQQERYELAAEDLQRLSSLGFDTRQLHARLQKAKASKTSSTPDSSSLRTN